MWQFLLPDPDTPGEFIVEWQSQPGDAVAMGGVMAGRQTGPEATRSRWFHRRLGVGVSLMFDIRPVCSPVIYTGSSSRMPAPPPKA